MNASVAERSAGRMSVVAGSLRERFRTSLFGLPSLWVVGSVLLWLVMGRIDDWLVGQDVPAWMDTTVESARVLLSAVASGTITAASVVFSLTLVALQLSSSSYSSRVLRTFLRDRFQQNMIGIVLATFFYSLLVLRDVRGPLAEGGSADVPGASVALATVLALVAILALLASISHTAASVRVSRVSASVLAEARGVIRDRLGEPGPEGRVDLQAPGIVPSPLAVACGPPGPAVVDPGRDGSLVVCSAAGGWVQQIGLDAVVGAVPPGSEVTLEVAVGTYVFEGGPLATVRRRDPTGTDDADQPLGSDPSGDTEDALRGAFDIGRERTMQQDVALGLTTLEDIALRALSPGIHDPNTARTVIPQLGDLVLEILACDLPPAEAEIGGVTIRRVAAPAHLDYLEAAFGQIRRAGHDQPEVRLTLLRTLVSIDAELRRRGQDSEEATDALRVAISRAAPAAGDAAAAGDGHHGTWSDSADPAVGAARELLESTGWSVP